MQALLQSILQSLEGSRVEIVWLFAASVQEVLSMHCFLHTDSVASYSPANGANLSLPLVYFVLPLSIRAG
jgi:hypothetical protein